MQRGVADIFFLILLALCIIVPDKGWCADVHVKDQAGKRDDVSLKTAARDRVHWYVDPAAADDSGDGSSWDTAKKTINGVWEVATWDDVIHLKNGVHTLTANISVTKPLTWVNENEDDDFQQCTINPSEYALKIYSVENGFTGITFDGGTGSRNLEIGQGATGTFSFCRFSNNGSTESGGAMYIAGDDERAAEAVFRHCEFDSNRSEKAGGAILGTRNCKLSCENCIFQNNQATTGGGAASIGVYYSSPPCEVSFIACSFLNNTGGNTGALDLRSGEYDVAYSVFEDNTATNDLSTGAAITCSDSGADTNIEINDCIFLRNESKGDGGAVRIANAYGDYEEKQLTFAVSDSLFSYNKGVAGAGLHCGRESGGTVRNCIFSHNEAEKKGGGLFNSGTVKAGGWMKVQYCLLFENTAGMYGGGMYISEYPWTEIQNCVFYENTAVENGHQIAGEPHIEDLQKASMTNTICWGSGENKQIIGLGNNTFDTVSYCCFPEGSFSDASAEMSGHIMNLTPLFNDPQNGDFRLDVTSSCIDEGLYVQLDTDIDGNPVPFGNGVDIGVYEFFSDSDIDCNGKLELKDIILALQILAGEKDVQICINSDVNRDAKIGMEEAIFVLGKLAYGGAGNQPPYSVGRRLGYFLWQDEDDEKKWYLRWSGDNLKTGDLEKTYYFEGTIISAAGFDENNSGNYDYEDNDVLEIGKTTISFSGYAGNGEDGIEFSTMSSEDRVFLDLYVDGVRDAAKVYIGKYDNHPKCVPFVIPRVTKLP